MTGSLPEPLTKEQWEIKDAKNRYELFKKFKETEAYKEFEKHLLTFMKNKDYQSFMCKYRPGFNKYLCLGVDDIHVWGRLSVWAGKLKLQYYEDEDFLQSRGELGD